MAYFRAGRQRVKTQTDALPKVQRFRIRDFSVR